MAHNTSFTKNDTQANHSCDSVPLLNSTQVEEEAPQLSVGDIRVVLYDQGWWIGEVKSVVLEKEYSIRFMSGAGKGRYKWTLENTVVHDNFVLDVVPELAPADSSCRFFKLAKESAISVAYDKYREEYML